MNCASHRCTSALLHNTHIMKKRFQIWFLEPLWVVSWRSYVLILSFFVLCSLCNMFNVQYFPVFACARSSVHMWIEFSCVLLIDSGKRVQRLFLQGIVSYLIAEYHNLE